MFDGLCLTLKNKWISDCVLLTKWNLGYHPNFGPHVITYTTVCMLVPIWAYEQLAAYYGLIFLSVFVISMQLNISHRSRGIFTWLYAHRLDPGLRVYNTHTVICMFIYWWLYKHAWNLLQPLGWVSIMLYWNLRTRVCEYARIYETSRCEYMYACINKYIYVDIYEYFFHLLLLICIICFVL